MLFEFLLRILHVVEENRTLIRDTKADLERVKQAMSRNMGNATEIETDLSELLQHPFDTAA